MRKIIVSLLVTPILVGCQTVKKDEIIINNEETEVTQHNYFEVEDKFINWSNIFGVKIDHYFVYFYSPTCSHCSELKDWIIEEALRRENIYFCKESQLDVISQNTASSIGAKSVDQISILGYPSLIEIKDKIVVKNVAGKTKIQSALIK